MQTSFQSQKAIRLGSVRFDADFGSGYVNLGWLSGATLTLNINNIALVVDNAKMQPRTKITSLILDANLYEFRLENLKNITGLGAFSSVDGTSKTATQDIASATNGQAIALTNQNWDGSTISTLTSITAGGSAFTDYTVITLEDGRSAILFKADATQIVATYSYTPLVSKQLILSDIIQSQQLSKYRFVNTDEDGKELIIEFPQGYNSGDSIAFAFLADETTDDALNFPIQITAFPDNAKKLCVITDEQDIL